MKLENCLCCDASVSTVLDWGLMPLANNYNVKELYPLKLNLCDTCKHLQLDESVEPEIMFKNYPYHSGTSQTAKDYFNEFTSIALTYYPTAKTVLDIACNDGTQLDCFKNLGLETFGIDPAENLLPISKGKGHTVFCGMFPEKELHKNNFDMVVCQNVVAHVPNPLEFLKGCKNIMHDNSFLFVATSQADMVNNNEFDTIYHEHISYFNTLSMSKLCERAELNLVDVFTNPIHGTSYIFVIRKTQKNDHVKKRIDNENKIGLFEKDTYTKWVANCEAKAKAKRKEIDEYREKGYVIVGCAAAAKGITFLNMSATKVDFLVDTTPAKWYSEAAKSTIFPFEVLKTLKSEKVLFVVLAWNFYNEIVQNVLKYRDNDKDIFITTNE